MSKINEQIQYHSALGFYKQGKSLAKKIDAEDGNKKFEFISVSTVCYSFSTELLIKLLIHIVSKKAIKYEHRLEEIFKQIPIEYQSIIEHKYESKRKQKNEKLKPIKFSFNSFLGNEKDSKDENNITELNITNLLKIHNESFVKWRYMYELEKEEYYCYEFNFKLMDDFINSIIEVINEKIKE